MAIPPCISTATRAALPGHVAHLIHSIRQGSGGAGVELMNSVKGDRLRQELFAPKHFSDFGVKENFNVLLRFYPPRKINSTYFSKDRRRGSLTRLWRHHRKETSLPGPPNCRSRQR